jgi:hypothetical protein
MQSIVDPANLSIENASKAQLQLAVRKLYSRLRKHNPNLPTDFPELISHLESNVEMSLRNDSSRISQDIEQ